LGEANRKSVLVVDDTHEELDVLRGILNGYYTVKVATNGRQALKVAFSDKPPDLILLDVMMPEMDGYEVCRLLKEDERTRKIPIIFLTAKSEMEEEAYGFSLGAADYLVKPISAPVVLVRVKTHLELYDLGEKSAPRQVNKLSQGTVIGAYEIIKELGKGATSVVYLARDQFADRQVAIKFLNLKGLDENESRQFKKLFLTEASLAGRIEHPYIVSIYDAVVTDYLSYLVMEYVGRGTLEHYCKIDSLLPVESVIEIIFKCCHALNYACHKGIIHRDIKPENILIAEGTDIKICDFGAAILKRVDSNKTAHIAGVGSLAYMSPQQAQEMELTQQTDIYSLGVIFYKMLTGVLPYTATDESSLLYQILNVDPLPPSSFRLDLPGVIDQIVMKLLSKNLEDRYQNWKEFERELTSAFELLPREVSNFPDTEKFNTLGKLDFFKEFGEVELWEVLRISKWAFYPEGTSIIREGNEAASFFIIISGEVEIRKNGRCVRTLNAGECFGEMSGILKESRRTASVYASKDIKLIELDEQLLGQASEQCQRLFDRAFLVLLAGRLVAAGFEDKYRNIAKTKLDTAPTGEPEAVKESDKNRSSSVYADDGTNYSQPKNNYGDPAKLSSTPVQLSGGVNIKGCQLRVSFLIAFVVIVVLIHFVSIPNIIQAILGKP
jgi:serine/threonine protein kinase